jgi:hypothetical protein
METPVSIEAMMENIVSALPEMSRTRHATVREVCLTYDQERWYAIAGGHPAVHIGEWGGDFEADGETAEEALAALLKSIKSGARI